MKKNRIAADAERKVNEMEAKRTNTLVKITRRAFVGMASAAMLAFGGCIICGHEFLDTMPLPRSRGGTDEAWAEVTNGAPVRAAVYVGPGARGASMRRGHRVRAARAVRRPACRGVRPGRGGDTGRPRGGRAVLRQ